MTLKRTWSRTPGKDHKPVSQKTVTKKMVYTMDEYQLLRLWSVIRCFAEIRENSEPIIQSEILTNAQIILTAIVFDLNPLVEDRARSAPPRISLSKIVTFDA
jgi:hypothetical protein